MWTHSAWHYTITSAILIFFYPFSVATHFPDTNKLTPKKNMYTIYIGKKTEESIFK